MRTIIHFVYTAEMSLFMYIQVVHSRWWLSWGTILAYSSETTQRYIGACLPWDLNSQQYGYCITIVCGWHMFVPLPKWNEHNLRRCCSLAHIHILIWTAHCIKLVGKPLLVRFYQIGAILVPGSLKRFVHFVCSRYNNSITGYIFASTLLHFQVPSIIW